MAETTQTNAAKIRQDSAIAYAITKPSYPNGDGGSYSGTFHTARVIREGKWTHSAHAMVFETRELAQAAIEAYAEQLDGGEVSETIMMPALQAGWGSMICR